jgi:hypothetical protein
MIILLVRETPFPELLGLLKHLYWGSGDARIGPRQVTAGCCSLQAGREKGNTKMKFKSKTWVVMAIIEEGKRGITTTITTTPCTKKVLPKSATEMPQNLPPMRERSSAACPVHATQRRAYRSQAQQSKMRKQITLIAYSLPSSLILRSI